MSNVPANLKYTESHEWVRVEADGTVTIGITDHAQEALGDLVFVELPDVGKNLAATQRQQAHGIGHLLNQLTGDTRKKRALRECGNGDGHALSLPFLHALAGHARPGKRHGPCDHRHKGGNMPRDTSQGGQ